MSETILLRPIGIIHTPFANKEQAPAQNCFAAGATGHVELFPEYVEGLRDIEGFSHLILLYNFHKSIGWSPITKPLLDSRERGIFAVRHYQRPNPIGLSLVRLIRRQADILQVQDVDMLDGTPLLDVKPYVPDFDARSNAKTGWYAHANNKK